MIARAFRNRVDVGKPKAESIEFAHFHVEEFDLAERQSGVDLSLPTGSTPFGLGSQGRD